MIHYLSHVLFSCFLLINLGATEASSKKSSLPDKVEAALNDRVPKLEIIKLVKQKSHLGIRYKITGRTTKYGYDITIDDSGIVREFNRHNDIPVLYSELPKEVLKKMKELAPGLRVETLQRIPRSRKELYKITGRMVEGDEILNVEMEIFKDGELKHMVRDDIDDDELYNDRRHEHD